MSKKSNKAEPAPIWADAKEVPVAGIETPTAVGRRAKWLRRFVMIGIVLLPISLLANLIMLGKQAAGADGPSVVSSSSQGQAAATVTLQKWLSADPAPLTGGRIVSWDGSTLNTPPEETESVGNDSTPAFPTERDTFTVIDDYGQLYRAVLLVSLDPAGGATVTGNPSLEPIPAARDNSAGDYAAWGSLRQIPAPDSVASAVKAWAKAYTTDAPDDLRLAVGDPDSSHSYVPLAGLTLLSVSVDNAAAAPGAPANTVTPDTMIARVTLTVSQGAVDTTPGQQIAYPTISYDLLVEGANTAAPKVVAWGGPGSGPALEPYANAVPSDVPSVTFSSLAPQTSDAESAPLQDPATTDEVVDTSTPPATTVEPPTAPSTTVTITPPPKNTTDRQEPAKTTAKKSAAQTTTAKKNTKSTPTTRAKKTPAKKAPATSKTPAKKAGKDNR